MEEFACKVNLGCGISAAEGWHNFDNSPSIWLSRIPLINRWKRIPHWPSNVRRLDVIKGLPFKPGSVDRIYSSHMIEHLTFGDAVKVLRHCHLALRIGGILRIAVPDLRIIVNDYLAGESAERFIDRLLLRSTASDILHKGANHQTMYDAAYLAVLFRQAGFPNPEQKQFAQSQIPDIGRVELEVRKHETLYMEATKSPMWSSQPRAETVPAEPNP